ncbi:hypothetical protein JZK55_04900 [Dissulfurispira thermophila]|uniref:Uncharacterized protein n=2 Tax=root TaxID=1 RepID=A0A7G1GZ94_9BACT|nr:hypothetical protein [Dissulfurispira thermophila]BCB95568.1 hypothetical protein JZK55_04900 [Dissulfurispira thermophila]
MGTTITQMSKEELKELIGSVVEQKMLELIGDPDEGLSIREDLLERLKRQKEQVARGRRSKSLDSIVKELGLE